jgi:hypothetical protein
MKSIKPLKSQPFFLAKALLPQGTFS